ncbi:metallophosphoesterase [Zobellella sp. An-6]|uniref:metallophosphoesterase n=1 Tax=Zobellella sp. An-6 TaxID=3400218 RepID=UPI0040413CFC
MQLQTFSANTRGNDFAIGDLHGCFDALRASLAEVGFNPGRDRLFSVGDLIDRGPRSLDCLSLVFEPWFFAVQGNHEQMMWAALECAGPGALAQWVMNGGQWGFEYDWSELKAYARTALARLPHAIEVELNGSKVGLVHAEVPERDWHSLHRPLTPVQLAQLVWARERLARRDATPIAHVDLVLAGHSIVPEVTRLGNMLYIDTGAFTPRGHLTLLEIRSWL